MTENREPSKTMSALGQSSERTELVLPCSPFIHIEGALNRLRLIYLRVVAHSKPLLTEPVRSASYRSDDEFKRLCGIRIDSPYVTPPVAIEDHLLADGFDPNSCHSQDWEHEVDHLSQALKELRRHPSDPALLLAELYSIKPGFHEAWLHEDYPNDVQEDLDQAIGRILGVNRGLRSELLQPSPAEFERLTNVRTFLGHAACAITDGPLVRRRAGVDSYFKRLRAIGAEPSATVRHRRLEDSFEVLDSWQYLQDQNSETGLRDLIEAASAFVNAGPLGPPENQGNNALVR